jgi:hypothetical protein
MSSGSYLSLTCGEIADCTIGSSTEFHCIRRFVGLNKGFNGVVSNRLTADIANRLTRYFAKLSKNELAFARAKCPSWVTALTTNSSNRPSKGLLARCSLSISILSCSLG